MAETIVTPVAGTHVKTGTVYAKGEGGRPVVVSGGGETTVTPDIIAAEQAAASPNAAQLGNPPAATPAQPKTLLEQFSPELDLNKVDITWDGGKPKLALRSESPAQVNSEEEFSADPQEIPDFPDQHQTIPGGTQPTPATPADARVVALEKNLADMAGLVNALVQGGLQGKSIADVLQSANGQPATPAEPDYSEVDMYDPAQAAKLMRDVVKAELAASMAQHQPTLEGARRRQEFEATQFQYGNDPQFNKKSIAAMQMVQQDPSLTIQAAYARIESIAQLLGTAPAAPVQPAAQPAQPQATPRTITADQAAKTAATAARLPKGGGGVRGAGPTAPPPEINTLGGLMLWNLQQAQLGNS